MGSPTTTAVKTITVVPGDGIGPEIMAACMKVLRAAGAEFDVEQATMGLDVYQAGNTSGISPEAWESIRRTKVLYKGPFTTPQGGGYKSINVTLRKSLGLYANVRPLVAYSPYVQTAHKNTNLIIIRENEEDLYAGIEHRQTQEVYQTLKLLSHPGSERIIRYAFEYARSHGRKSVVCMTKDNIMKVTDGMFHRTFDEVSTEYPDIHAEHMIIDIGTARLAANPEAFDVVVVPNLYGDVLSDVAALLTGSVGLAGSANLGGQFAMFEAVHGSAPDIAGQSIANPSGLLLAGVLMVHYLGQGDVALTVQDAWLKTLEDGLHTADIYHPDHSTAKVGTEAFAEAVIERLGQKPQHLIGVLASGDHPLTADIKLEVPPRAKKEPVGMDVFIDWVEADRDPKVLGERLSRSNGEGLELVMITNRGQKVWPGETPATYLTDHWRCRFQVKAGETTDDPALVRLLDRIVSDGFDLIKTEGLFLFDGKPGFSLGQGQ